MRIVLSALRQILRVWHRWMCAGLPNRTGEIVARGPLQIRGVSLPARISVLQTEEAGSAPARPATVSLLRLFLPLGRSVRRRILNPDKPGSTPGGAASQSRTGDGACAMGRSVQGCKTTAVGGSPKPCSSGSNPDTPATFMRTFTTVIAAASARRPLAGNQIEHLAAVSAARLVEQRRDGGAECGVPVGR